MKQVSYWASRHIAAARLIIILLYIPINILGYLTGSLLWDVEIELTASFINSVAFLAIVIFTIYRNKASYIQKKALQFAMGVCTFCVVCFYGNQTRNTNFYLPFSNTTHAVSLIEHTNTVTEKEKYKTKQAKKILKKYFRNAVPDENGRKVWVKILLIVLSVAVAIVLLYGLALLACTISCNGAEVAAWLVGILGLAGIITGLFFVIRSIVGRKKKVKEPSSAN